MNCPLLAEPYNSLSPIDIADTIRNLPIKFIADHQGGMKGLSALPVNVTDVTGQTGFAELMGLAKTGQLFIKVSGFYRSSKLTTGGYDDLESLRLLHKKCLTS